jgi:hypothetical protein
MKKIICTVMVFALLADVSAQLKVDSTGQVGVGIADGVATLYRNTTGNYNTGYGSLALRPTTWI